MRKSEMTDQTALNRFSGESSRTRWRTKMDWKKKAKIFKVLSKIPMGGKIHFLLQRTVTKEWPRRAEALEQLFVAAQRLIEETDGRLDLRHSQFIEIGAGRDLAVATALCLMGVNKVTCIDITRLAKPYLVAHAARYMASKLGESCPKLETWDDIEAFGIRYIAPADMVSLALPTKSIDCFYSVDTLEHIPRPDLEKIIVDVERILKPNGLAINFIDYSDHFARGVELSRFNFLTFSDEQWMPFNSKFQYVNRMRHSEYLEMFHKAGLRPFDIVADVEDPEPDIVENLSTEFKRFSTEDLFTIRAKIIASPKP